MTPIMLPKKVVLGKRPRLGYHSNNKQCQTDIHSIAETSLGHFKAFQGVKKATGTQTYQHSLIDIASKEIAVQTDDGCLMKPDLITSGTQTLEEVEECVSCLLQDQLGRKLVPDS